MRSPKVLNMLKVLGIALLFLATPAEASLSLSKEIRLDGVSYLPADIFSKANRFDYYWEPFLKNVMISGPGGRIKLHVGSEYLLDDGLLVKLNEKSRFFNGGILIPSSAVPYFEHLQGARSAEAVWESPPPHRIRRVVVDAGHGGRDYGAISPYGTREKDVVLDIARRVARDLEERGLEVILTRNTDTFVPLEKRANIANKKRADLFVSIHANASASRRLRGFEVYTLSEATDDEVLALERAENSPPGLEKSFFEKPSTALKAIVWDLKESENRDVSIRTAGKISGSVERSVPVGDKRVRSAQFYVLKMTECPSVLVETGYLTNREDEKRLRKPLYRAELARAVVRGLADAIAEFEKTNGFTT